MKKNIVLLTIYEIYIINSVNRFVFKIPLIAIYTLSTKLKLNTLATVFKYRKRVIIYILISKKYWLSIKSVYRRYFDMITWLSSFFYALART